MLAGRLPLPATSVTTLAMSSSFLLRLAPALFVFIWSTGWIVAKYAAPHADPLTFLSMRYMCAGLVVGGFAYFSGAPAPKSRSEALHLLLSGVLMHALYLGGVWWAIAHGLPAGISALIAALQPLLTALAAKPFSGESISFKRWIGVGLGFLGILIVLQPKFASLEWGGLGGLLVPLAVNIVGTVAVTLGTFHQKRFLGAPDLRVMAGWQYLGAFLATFPLAFLLEPMRLDIEIETLYALLWSVIVLSIGAIALLLMMIRHGSVARTSALIYLVPPTAALQAYFMFGETLLPLQLGGMAVVALGVYLATKG